MSYIKAGLCKQCDQNFYWSVGHPEGWNSWTLDVSEMPPAQRWWHSFGQLCPSCAPPAPSLVEGDDIRIKATWLSECEVAERIST